MDCTNPCPLWLVVHLNFSLRFIKISLQIPASEIRTMTKLRTLFAVLFVAAVLSLPFLQRSSAQSMAPSDSNAARSSANDPKLVYPVTKRIEQVDDYFGTKVYDPYRWLEDETSAETKAWVEEENRLTFSYLDKIPFREKLKTRLT